MSLRDWAYNFQLKYMPLYQRVISMKDSPYHYGNNLCPVLLFRKETGSYSVFDHSLHFSLWLKLFHHEQYGLAFFAYHTAIIECYPRLIWKTFHPFFSQLSDHTFYEILLHTSFTLKKSILIRSVWFSTLANNISILNIYHKRVERSIVWRLFFASLNLYNAVIQSMPPEQNRLALIPALGQSWNMLYHHERQDHSFSESGISDSQNGVRRHTVVFPHSCLPDLAPEDWKLETFLREYV